MEDLTGEAISDDLQRLRAKHPDWLITTIWAAASIGSDRRMIVAQRHGAVLSDFTADGLAAKIQAEATR